MYRSAFIFLTIVLFNCLSSFTSTLASSIVYKNNKQNFYVEQVLKGLGIPWGLAFIDRDKLLFSQRNGKLGIYNLTTDKLQWVSNVPRVYSEGQGGLLDIAPAPDYKQSGWIYFTYSKQLGDKSATTLAKARLSGTKLIDWQDVLISQSREDSSYHFGSRIAFDQQEHVFFSIGDRGNRPNGQNLQNHAGAILRLNLDGSIPGDNPFVNKKGLDEIWSYGHRNPQGLVFDKQSGRLWSIEHGPRGGDEINLIEPGNNYGWPVISYGKEYWGPVAVGEGTHKEGMQQPHKTYIPSIAPGSLMIYSGKAFPKWQGNLFAGALALRHINRVVVDKQGKLIDEQRLLKQLNERIRCIIEADNGWIYFSTDSGKILRLKPL